jgi:hypothetical protein
MIRENPLSTPELLLLGLAGIGVVGVVAYAVSKSSAPAGKTCQQDSDCPGGNCNQSLSQCLGPQPTGVQCAKGVDCVSKTCTNAGTCQ